MAGSHDRADIMDHSSYRHINVTQIGGVIGAIVSGLRMAGDVAPAAVGELRAALLRHRVIFLRDQHATDEEQVVFAELLGPITKPHPSVKGDGEAVLPIEAERGKANRWHTDVSFVDRIPAISVLRAITLPPYGGTTVWASTVEAYRRLHPGLKALTAELRAVHTNVYDYSAEYTQVGGIDVKRQKLYEEIRHHEFETEHPVVSIHPETGEPSLLLGHFARSFVGLNEADSHDLFSLLQRHITRLENTVRWAWRDGDVAIWDNRATQHSAVADYGNQPRLLHRVTVAGDLKTGIRGDKSTVRKGDASNYSVLS